MKATFHFKKKYIFSFSIDNILGSKVKKYYYYYQQKICFAMLRNWTEFELTDVTEQKQPVMKSKHLNRKLTSKTLFKKIPSLVNRLCCVI